MSPAGEHDPRPKDLATSRTVAGRRVDRRRCERHARARLRRFRQASRLAVGATALLLLVAPGPAQEEPLAEAEGRTAVEREAPPEATADDRPTATESVEQATGTLRELGRDTVAMLPALGVVLALLLVAALLARLVRWALRAALKSWERAEAASAIAAIGIWLLALGAALSVLAGDARALLGSLGLFGLALSWALQTPIESFTGWLLNSFRGYYRVGDRILVGDVFGDVAKIDFLTTTIFEAGGPGKRVQAAQSTGALITFPNFEVLRSNIVNYTRDFPFVWDELTVAVANESDLSLAITELERIANEVVGERMAGAAEEYAAILERRRLGWDVATRPEIYVVARDSWTDLTVRYLVPVREMRRWSSRLLLAIDRAFDRPEIAARVFPGYVRSQVERVPPSRPAPRPVGEPPVADDD